MSAKRKTGSTDNYKETPMTLQGEPFYGLELDEYQQAYRDAIWNPEVRLVTCSARAGTGKTQIAVATACLLYRYGIVDGCLYIRTPSSEGRIGFLPGDRASKERPYMQPLYNSLISIGENPYTSIDTSTNMENKKYATEFWQTITDVYLLGDDFKNKAIILDEAQCLTLDQLRAVLTRCHDTCKVIVIGSTLQIQGIDKGESGFVHCIEHFKSRPWARHCELVKNYRGELSAWADLL